jgi:hypothetical protein
VNYDPGTWYILTDGPGKIGGLEQFALYQVGIPAPHRQAARED